MKLLQWILLMSVAVPCGAQVPCSKASALSSSAERVHSIRKELERVHTEEMDTTVPPAARDQLVQLKDALSDAADAALACAEATTDASGLEKKIAAALNTNQPESTEKEGIGPYGGNLGVSVVRPPNLPALLEIEFSFGIECGDDHMLLVYAFENGAWKQTMRWQAPPLKEISDAFGDFFLQTLTPASTGKDAKQALVVAHGTPWCTSRFSALKIDVLLPSSDPKSPKVLWHTERGYSRGDFEPRLKSSENTFEVRVNAPCIDVDAFERRVIFHYRIDNNKDVTRIKPLAANARGFIEEWLSAPWSESQLFTEPDSAAALQSIHDQLKPPHKVEGEFVSNSYGPVRACDSQGVFQVQINSTLEKFVSGKPGGESRTLPSRYFHVREVPNGYLLFSAPSEPDPACKGKDLMPSKRN